MPLNNDDDVPRRYLNETDTARYLGISVRWLHKARMQGSGPRFVKFSSTNQGAVRYDTRDLDAWAEKRKTDRSGSS